MSAKFPQPVYTHTLPAGTQQKVGLQAQEKVNSSFSFSSSPFTFFCPRAPSTPASDGVLVKHLNTKTNSRRGCDFTPTHSPESSFCPSALRQMLELQDKVPVRPTDPLELLKLSSSLLPPSLGCSLLSLVPSRFQQWSRSRHILTLPDQEWDCCMAHLPEPCCPVLLPCSLSPSCHRKRGRSVEPDMSLPVGSSLTVCPPTVPLQPVSLSPPGCKRLLVLWNRLVPRWKHVPRFYSL